MASTHLISSVSEACDFACKWLAVSEDLSGPEIRSAAMPQAIRTLNSRFGKLWHGREHCLLRTLNNPDHPLHLLEYQDFFQTPDRYREDNDGFVSVISENQGVHDFGFRSPDLETLYVKGCWCDGDRTGYAERWRTLGTARVDDAVIYTLLGNLCVFVSTSEGWSTARPADAEIPLWSHPAWRGVDDFWTNRDFTMMYYGGGQLTVRR